MSIAQVCSQIEKEKYLLPHYDTENHSISIFHIALERTKHIQTKKKKKLKIQTLNRLSYR